MGVSKVIYNGETLISLIGDSVKKENLLKGETAHDQNGELVTGECEYDFNTSSDEIMLDKATAADIYPGKKAAVGGAIVVGSMKNNESVSGTITTKDGVYTVPKGYHDGGGKVRIDSSAVSALLPENIREGRTILGVLGTMTGDENEKPQSDKEVYAPLDPNGEDLVVEPDTEQGYTCLTRVVVKKVPYAEINNGEGKGVTIRIG